MLALLGQEEGIVLPLLHRVEVDIVAARNEAELVLDKLPNAYGSEPQLSRALRNVFDKADQVREDLTDEYLSTEHLLLALHGQCKGLGGVDHETLLTALREVRGSHRVTSQNPENQYQALERFGLDLTERARKGELDPVIGRDEEIRRVIRVLSRRTKNNPVLIGEPGVGKTAIVEGLARSIHRGETPEALSDAVVYSLDVGALVAGIDAGRSYTDWQWENHANGLLPTTTAQCDSSSCPSCLSIRGQVDFWSVRTDTKFAILTKSMTKKIKFL